MTLHDHRQGLNTVLQQRRLLDQSFANLIAAGVKEGHTVSDLLDDSRPTAEQPGFDL